MGYQYCEGCNTYYVHTGCGQDDEHANCPPTCGMCGKLITRREGEHYCQGHSITEHREWVARLLQRWEK